MKLIPIHLVDRAVRRIERWGTTEEIAAMHDAVSLANTDSQRSRAAIIAVDQ